MSGLIRKGSNIGHNAPASPRQSSKSLQRPSSDDRALGVHAIVPLVFKSAIPMSGLRILFGTIVRVLSTVCNYGQVSRGCMLMQSTTRHSTLDVNGLILSNPQPSVRACPDGGNNWQLPRLESFAGSPLSSSRWKQRLAIGDVAPIGLKPMESGTAEQLW